MAPIMMPKPCLSVNRPALTRPTVITVVAPLACSTAVTTAPRSIPMASTPVIASKIFCSLAPAAFCKPSPMSCMPYINKAIPPKKPRKYTSIMHTSSKVEF